MMDKPQWQITYTTYKGQPLSSFSKEELMEIIGELAKAEWEDRKARWEEEEL